MQDFFPTMSMKPNETCDDSFCRQRQKERKEFKLLNPEVKEEIKEECVIHETNDWGKTFISKLEYNPIYTHAGIHNVF